MFVYNLQVSMSDKRLFFDDALTNAVIEAIDIANNSFSANRYNRKIEFIRKSDDLSYIELRMSSKNAINPNRSISSLSRALVKNESEKNSGLLDGHIINSCVLNTKVINSDSDTITSIDPVTLVQEVTSIVLGQKFLNDKETKLAKEAYGKIEEVVLDYVNKKRELNFQQKQMDNYTENFN